MYFSFSPSPSRSSYTTLPMDMPSTSSSRPQSPSCAYPSWPRRSSLSSNSSSEGDETPSSFISDDDLEDLFPPVFDDADPDCTPIASPSTIRSPGEPAGAQHQVLVDTQALMRELVKEEKAKKDKKRRGRTSSRKSRTSSSGKRMSSIQEVNE